MKNGVSLRNAIVCIILTGMVSMMVACGDDLIPGGKHDPVWTYDTGENPYGSKPWVSGDRLVVCSRVDGEDIGTVHCLNLSDGKSIWKMTDSTVVRNNPVVWNNKVIYGGYNVHALNLSDGSHSWNYQDDLIRLMLYSSPHAESGFVYLASTYSMIKLHAENGSLVWENTENPYQNISLAAPFYHSGKIYYGNTLGLACSMNAATGAIDWSVQMESGISNTPVSDGSHVFIGIQELNKVENSLFSYPLNGSVPVWTTKLWQITSNIALSDSRLYLAGGSTFYCIDAGSGTQQWSYPMSVGTIAEPVVHNGKVYTGNGDEILCLDSGTGKVEWSFTSGGSGFSSPAVNGDRLYVACSDGKIYCFDL